MNVRWLSQEELQALRRNIKDPSDTLLLDVLYETGCSINELINIRIEDINLRKATIEIRTDGKRRTTYVSQELCKRLEQATKRLAESDHLFATRHNQQLSTKSVRTRIQNYSQKAFGAKINPQVIRYTHFAHALHKGIPLEAIQRQLGINALRAVQLYQAIAPKKAADYKRFFD